MSTSPIKRPGRPRDPDLEQRRRGEILDVAARVFAEFGFSRTDLQEVADRLNIGKGTIYRYFTSKQELFLQAVDRGLTELTTRIEALSKDQQPSLAILETKIQTYLAFFDANPHMVELFIQERAEFRDRKVPLYFQNRDECTEHRRQFLRTLMASGQVRELEPERVMDVVGDLLYGTIFTNYLVGRKVSFEVQARDIVDIVFNGILSDSERLARAQSR